MFEHVDTMYETQTLYTVIQGLVLIMLILRLLTFISFQSKLSVISGTLARAAPDVIHFVLIILISGLAFCAMVGTVFGSRVQQVSSVELSLQTLMSFVVLGDDGGALGDIGDSTVAVSAAEAAVASIVSGFSPLFFLFVMQNFLLAFIGWPYYELTVITKGRCCAMNLTLIELQLLHFRLRQRTSAGASSLYC